MRALSLPGKARPQVSSTSPAVPALAGRNRAFPWPARLRNAAGILGGAAAIYLASTTVLTFQDAASFMTAGLNPEERARLHLVAAPHGSIHRASLGYGENTLRGTGATRDVGLADATTGDAEDDPNRMVVVPAALSAVVGDARHGDIRTGMASGPSLTGRVQTYPSVNRAAKGDFLISRTPGDFVGRAEAQPGSFRRLDRMIFDEDVSLGQRSSFEAPRADGADVLVASLPNTFTNFGEGEVAGKTMLAALPRAHGGSDNLMPAIYHALLPKQNLPRAFGEAEEQVLALFGGGTHSNWKQSTPLRLSRKQQKCLAEGVYHEARGEPYEGQLAVAQVIVNRMQSRHWPNSICGVVYQNRHWRNRCQFSFACDRIPDRIRDRPAWAIAKDIAKKFSDGFVLDGIDRATHYHATYVNPRWARYFNRIDKIGLHIFYRSRTGGWS